MSQKPEIVQNIACSKLTEIEDLRKKLEHLVTKGQPEEPLPDDCCGSGCTPCVFDTYYDQLEKFEEKKDRLESKILEYEDEFDM